MSLVFRGFSFSLTSVLVLMTSSWDWSPLAVLTLRVEWGILHILRDIFSTIYADGMVIAGIVQFFHQVVAVMVLYVYGDPVRYHQVI